MVKELVLAVLLAGTVFHGDAVAMHDCFEPGRSPMVEAEHCQPDEVSSAVTLCEVLEVISEVIHESGSFSVTMPAAEECSDTSES